MTPPSAVGIRKPAPSTRPCALRNALYKGLPSSSCSTLAVVSPCSSRRVSGPSRWRSPRWRSRACQRPAERVRCIVAAPNGLSLAGGRSRSCSRAEWEARRERAPPPTGEELGEALSSRCLSSIAKRICEKWSTLPVE
eukprot:scaffold85877_cov34-Tisochrysis_lutea.AAC.4